MVASVAVLELPKKLLAYTLLNLYPVIPRFVVLSPSIAGALGPPNDNAVAESTNDTSGPLGPVSKLSVPVLDLTVGLPESTNILS